MSIPVMSVAHEIRTLAEGLIGAHHVHLAEAHMLYVFTDQKRKRCDRVRVGSAAKLSSLQRFLASGLDSVEDGPDFIILIDSKFWQVVTLQVRSALIDHELCHCALFVNNSNPAKWRRIHAGENPDDFADRRWGLRGHDIEEFGEVLARHGFWKPEAPEREFGEIVLQVRMPERSNGTRTTITRKSDGKTVGGS